MILKIKMENHNNEHLELKDVKVLGNNNEVLLMTVHQHDPSSGISIVEWKRSPRNEHLLSTQNVTGLLQNVPLVQVGQRNISLLEPVPVNQQIPINTNHPVARVLMDADRNMNNIIPHPTQNSGNRTTSQLRLITREKAPRRETPSKSREIINELSGFLQRKLTSSNDSNEQQAILRILNDIADLGKKYK